MRRCGGCTLCCELLPILPEPGMLPAWYKPACTPCPHQRDGEGCAVYSCRPTACRTFSCRWLDNRDTADLQRPDRARYVIETRPGVVTVEQGNIETVQVWCDPKTPDAWRDPALLAYLERRAGEGIAAVVRFGSASAILVMAPPLRKDRQWHEVNYV